MRREEECVGKRVMVVDVPRKGRGGGRPKRRWMDSIKYDLR